MLRALSLPIGVVSVVTYVREMRPKKKIPLFLLYRSRTDRPPLVQAIAKSSLQIVVDCLERTKSSLVTISFPQSAGRHDLRN